MRKASLPIAFCLIALVVTGAIGQQQAPQQAAAAQPRTHSVVMREIANTRGGFINAVLAGNAEAALQSATRLEGLYKEFVVFYEQMKLEPGLSMAKEGLMAASEGVAAVKAKNFEAAAATHRMISRGCRDCHPIYRQEAPDGLTYLPQWKPKYRSLQ